MSVFSCVYFLQLCVCDDIRACVRVVSLPQPQAKGKYEKKHIEFNNDENTFYCNPLKGVVSYVGIFTHRYFLYALAWCTFCFGRGSGTKQCNGSRWPSTDFRIILHTTGRRHIHNRLQMFLLSNVIWMEVKALQSYKCAWHIQRRIHLLIK